VGVEGKPVHTGTPRTSEPGRLALRAKARADVAHVLSGSFSTSDTLLDRSRHGAGELRCGVAQWIIPGGYSGVYARFQIGQPAQRADDPPADLLDHGGNVGVGRGRALEKGHRPWVHLAPQGPARDCL